MARRSDSQAAKETLEEIESVFDRMAGWVTEHPGQFLGGIGAILAVAGGISLEGWYTARKESRASQAVAEIEAGYLAAMGAAPGSVQIVEPANPETGRTVRLEYVNKFLAAAEEQEGSVAATQALLTAGNLQEKAGDLEAALAAWRRAADAAQEPALKGLLLTRLARGLEGAERWNEAAGAHEQAGDLTGFPARYHAMADAARCHAEAGNRERAVEISLLLEDEAPDLPLPDHLQARLRELRIAGS